MKHEMESLGQKGQKHRITIADKVLKRIFAIDDAIFEEMARYKLTAGKHPEIDFNGSDEKVWSFTTDGH